MQNKTQQTFSLMQILNVFVCFEVALAGSCLKDFAEVKTSSMWVMCVMW